MKENKIEQRERAKHILSEHKYTLLSKGQGCELWKCAKPNSSTYCFNISIMPYGIAVVGDIGDYTFNFHPDGINFLAGEDIDYYIYSKLTHNSKETQYAKEYVRAIVSEQIVEKFYNDEKLWDIFTEDELVKIQEDIKNYENNFSEIKNYIYLTNNEYLENPKVSSFLDDVEIFLNEVYLLDSEVAAFHLLDNDEVIGFADDMDYNFTEPSSSLMQTLYIINEAAKEILLQKANDD